jgi:hypothetical protein
MVREEKDDGIASEAILLQLMQDSSGLLIHERHLRVQIAIWSRTSGVSG